MTLDPATRFDVSVLAAALSGWVAGKALVGWAQVAADALGRRRKEARP
jgi:hypothetical protein